MEKQFGDTRYWTTFIEDRKGGYAGYRLHGERRGKTWIVAEVIYWDATGRFCVKTIETDVPVEILERVIEEAKQQIKIK